MSKRTYTFLTILIGVICAYVILAHVFSFSRSISVRNDVIQGFFVGFGMALVITQLFGWVKSTKVNGWTTMFGLGRPSNGMMMRAACALLFPGPVNVPEESMYWTTSSDGAGRPLDGRRNYRMHFPAGGLPPNEAFWSLTMGDAQNRFVANPLNRYSLSDRSGLVANADGSVDIYMQSAAPAGHESNWLPAPSGKFSLWLRVYMPGAAILDGKYTVPPVVDMK